MNKKAVALISGGLDSALAAKMILDMGIDVHGINFVLPFDIPRQPLGDTKDRAQTSAIDIGIPLKTMQLGMDYIEMLRNPCHGYGKAINPCIDCHAFFLRKAGEFMRETGADFIVTGEVLGQRPMSQRRDTLKLVENESGLRGLILRPLSAKQLDPTIAETEGWVDRNKLLGIKGRSRHEQFQLAEKIGVREYPLPAGGCLLTELSFAPKVRDLLSHPSHNELRDFQLLKTGRHFRLAPQTKLILGRSAADNAALESILRSEDTTIAWMDGKTPLGVITGTLDAELIKIAMQILLRYTKAEPGQQCRMQLRCSEAESVLYAENCFNEESAARYRIDA